MKRVASEAIDAVEANLAATPVTAAASKVETTAEAATEVKAASKTSLEAALETTLKSALELTTTEAPLESALKLTTAEATLELSAALKLLLAEAHHLAAETTAHATHAAEVSTGDLGQLSDITPALELATPKSALELATPLELTATLKLAAPLELTATLKLTAAETSLKLAALKAPLELASSLKLAAALKLPTALELPATLELPPALELPAPLELATTIIVRERRLVNIWLRIGVQIIRHRLPRWKRRTEGRSFQPSQQHGGYCGDTEVDTTFAQQARKRTEHGMSSAEAARCWLEVPDTWTLSVAASAIGLNRNDAKKGADRNPVRHDICAIASFRQSPIFSAFCSVLARRLRTFFPWHACDARTSPTPTSPG